MRARRLPPLAAALLVGCISPSVLPPEQRATASGVERLEWAVASAADVPGTFVSVELTGRLAAALRMVVYRFDPDGSYTGAALVDDVPPSFQVISGRWEAEEGLLRLDGGPPATLEVAGDGSLRMSGAEGVVVLRREIER